MIDIGGYKVDPVAGLIFSRRGRVIKKSSKGYVLINSRINGEKLAHRIVWTAANGPIPEGKQINHINGVKHDNRIANLELTDQSGNTKHAYAMGFRSADGTNNGRAKLTEEDVLDILKSSASRNELASRYGIGLSTLSDLFNGKTWTHLRREQA